jgi:hypothetical protein
MLDRSMMEELKNSVERVNDQLCECVRCDVCHGKKTCDSSSASTFHIAATTYAIWSRARNALELASLRRATAAGKR